MDRPSLARRLRARKVTARAPRRQGPALCRYVRRRSVAPRTVPRSPVQDLCDVLAGMTPMPALRRILILAATLAALLTTPALAETWHGGQNFVTMADGTELAVWVQFPKAYDGTSRLPVIFEYDGCDGGAQASFYSSVVGVNQDYITVHAGVRGAGCSNGDFSLFSQQQAE